MHKHSTLRKLLNIRFYVSSFSRKDLSDRFNISSNSVDIRLSQMSAYLQQLSQEPKTNKPSHYTEEVKYDSQNPWKKRNPEELSSLEEAPYQQHYYDPPNDKTTQLYNNFRDSSHCRYPVALREHAPRRFVPGVANAYLRSHSRLYSNHYIRLAPESEAPSDMMPCIIIYSFFSTMAFIFIAPAIFLYFSPEHGGTPFHIV